MILNIKEQLLWTNTWSNGYLNTWSSSSLNTAFLASLIWLLSFPSCIKLKEKIIRYRIMVFQNRVGERENHARTKFNGKKRHKIVLELADLLLKLHKHESLKAGWTLSRTDLQVFTSLSYHSCAMACHCDEAIIQIFSKRNGLGKPERTKWENQWLIYTPKPLIKVV